MLFFMGLNKEYWNKTARGLLKAELGRCGMTYDELAKRMTALGMPETKDTVGNKMMRGAFQASFFLAAMKAIGRKVINIEEI